MRQDLDLSAAKSLAATELGWSPEDIYYFTNLGDDVFIRLVKLSALTFDEGREVGYEEGYDYGREAGYDEGYDDGCVATDRAYEVRETDILED